MLIVLMTIVRSLVDLIMSVALMVVAILAKMLPVAQIMAAHVGKTSHLLLFQLFFSLIFRMPAALSAA